ncbi:MAG: glycosyltransferase family 4 protein [Oligoflexia bacterium]|jgi:glycosyltransferase involved in cell wall biosynthesis
MNLRVGLIAPPFESVPPRLYGGTERVVWELARGLNAAHVETVVFASGDSTVPGRLIATTPEALRLKRPAIQDAGPFQFQMLSLVKKHADQVDILHNHNDYWMLPLHQMVQTPMVTTLHGRLDLPELPVALRSEPKASFISISRAQREPIPDLKWARTIHHGLDLTRFQFNPRPGNYLAFLGRISPEKRPDLAVQIALQAQIPLKIAAKIEPGRDREYYDARVAPHVDGKFIEYIGEISESEKSDFLGGALALVFPIDWPEPFGLVMIEALACGTPVLARPFGSVPEVLENGVTGFINSDPSQLARLAREAALLDRLRCRETAAQRFSIERVIEEHLEVYRWILNSKS